MRQGAAPCCLLAFCASLALLRAAEPEQTAADPTTMAQLPDDPKTLSQMLQWSIDNTDLQALHQKAEAIRAGTAEGKLSKRDDEKELLSASDGLPLPEYRGIEDDLAMRDRLRELSEVASEMMPDQAKLMREALELAANATAEDADRERGLLNLQELVSDLDNAKDLKAMDEYPSILTHLISEQPAMQTAAAWVIGSAVQNHREMQLHLLSLGALSSLLNLIASHYSADLRAKALYAASALLRNCPEARAEFMQHDGVGALISALSETSSPKVVRKALVLLTDLLDEEIGGDGTVTTGVKAHASSSRGVDDHSGGEISGVELLQHGLLQHGLQNGTRLCDAISQSLAIEDTDAQEKAVFALQKLLDTGIMSILGSNCAKEAFSVGLKLLKERCEAEEMEFRMTQEGCAAAMSLQADLSQ